MPKLLTAQTDKYGHVVWARFAWGGRVFEIVVIDGITYQYNEGSK